MNHINVLKRYENLQEENKKLREENKALKEKLKKIEEAIGFKFAIPENFLEDIFKGDDENEYAE